MLTSLESVSVNVVRRGQAPKAVSAWSRLDANQPHIAQLQKRGSELGPNTELQVIPSTGENRLGAFHDLERKAGLSIPFS